MDPKIVIIGAGASGIAAATKLIQYGFKNVIILEAENRYGGRIHTVPFGDNVLDMGAQWCHGEEDNVVYHAVKHLNPFDSSQAQYNRFDCFRSNKEFVPKDVTDRLTCLVQNILFNSRIELQHAKGISLGMYLTKKYEEALKDPEYSYIDKELAGQFLEMYKKYENSVESCDSLFDASGSGYGEYWECEGDTLLNWKDKGYVTFLHFLMGVYPNEKNKNILENRILLNKTVEEIIWDSPGDNKVHIKCADGDKIEADHVICTVSLGVLKERHPELFIPCLPELKVRAIEGLTIGTVDKLFIQFPEPFWPKGWVGFNLMWQKDDLHAIRLSKDSWLEDVFGFYMVDYQPNVLCGWMSGSNARRMEMLSDKETLDGIMYLLRKFLIWNIPNPVGFKRSTWYKNQNFRGSYTYRSMAAERLGVGPSDLAQPVRNSTSNTPVLLFAGEATHDHFYSTVHGATESGWREANRLAELYPARRKSQL